MERPISSLLIILFVSSSTAIALHNIVDLGAKPDGLTDSAGPFIRAWDAACRANNPATIYVPAGMFFLSRALLQGPCNNAGIRIWIDGTIVADSGYSSSTEWITFKNVDGVSIYGGILEGRGKALWACKKSGRSCPIGATSLTIAQSKNVLISGLTSFNSELFHVAIYDSNSVTVQGAKISAPWDSPNTDGIHVQMSSGVTITGTAIRTGDDCVSMGPGSANVWIQHISCGPGHGISIGSLGETAQEAGVQSVVVRSVVFTGTQNGLRIKTWANDNNGFVKGVVFQHAIMQNVENPIIVDQNYCPDDIGCPNQSSGIKISEVSYSDVEGTSATQVAVRFDCSSSNPCSGISLQDVKLTYEGKPAESVCEHVHGIATGTVIPPSCL